MKAEASVYVMHRKCENTYTNIICINLNIRCNFKLKHILIDYQLIPMASLLYVSFILNLLV